MRTFAACISPLADEVTMGDDAHISPVYRAVTHSDFTYAATDDARTRRLKCGVRHPSSPVTDLTPRNSKFEPTVAPSPCGQKSRSSDSEGSGASIIAERVKLLLATVSPDQRPLWANYFRLMAREARRT
jgi:hypothetical protein